MARKRDREEETAADMVVKVAEGEPLPAQSFLLRTFSAVARALPADAEQWDVSGLLYDGQQPFSRATVQCWLACARSCTGMGELGAEDIEQLSTAKGLHEVLSFAQAVGPAPALLQAACSQQGALVIALKAEQQTLRLPMTGGTLAWLPPTAPQQQQQQPQQQQPDSFQISLLSSTKRAPIGSPVTIQQLTSVRREAAAQTGALLLMAHVLRLQPLIDALHSFVTNAAATAAGLLYGVLQLVFTDAVLDAALGSSTVSKYTYISSLLTQPCSFTRSAWTPWPVEA
jgi:hypothetical protein